MHKPSFALAGRRLSSSHAAMVGLMLEILTAAPALAWQDHSDAAIVEAADISGKTSEDNPLTVKRVVLIYRHGIRSPLPGEAPVDAYAPPAWPEWQTPATHLTPHGYRAAKLIGAYDRERLTSLGLLQPDSCPAVGDVVIWTNSIQRTIASGQALAEGVAPGCALDVGHRALGTRDPIFQPDPGENGGFDANAAVASIMAETGGPARLIAPYARQVRQMEAILGCDRRHPPCDILTEASALAPNADGRGVALSGPIATLSGTAQVLMLQYAEGKPLQEVGWGRAGPQTLEDISRLHSLLFDIHARPQYMARWIGGALSRRILSALTESQGANVTILVGHDNTIAAFASLIGAHFKMDGYAQDDPPIGGALGLELIENRSGERFVRTFYQAQTPDQLRQLTPLSIARPPALRTLTPACASRPDRLCRLDDFVAYLQARLTQK